MKIKIILYFVWIVFYSDVTAQIVCDWETNFSGPQPPIEYDLEKSRLYEENLLPGATVDVAFTNNDNTIEGVRWRCTNLEEKAGKSPPLPIPIKINNLDVTDISQLTLTPILPDNGKDIKGSSTIPTTINATLQAAAFNDDSEMLPLDSWLNSQKDTFTNLLFDIVDFTRTDENGPLYFCVPLNKLALKGLTVPLKNMNAIYQVENGKITQLNWGEGPSPEQLENFYLSTEKCNLGNSSFGTSITSLPNGKKWGNDNPFNGEVYLFAKHVIQLLVELDYLSTLIEKEGIRLIWQTNTEISNSGFRLWRATKDQYSNYKSTLLREFGHFELVNPESNENCSTKIQGKLEIDNPNQLPKLISAIGNSAESTCYSFTDTSNLSDGTYYYLLEDIGDNGKSTFHCDQIDAVTIGQGPAIDLGSAINYCKEVTGSNN